MVEIKQMLVPDSVKPKYHVNGKAVILKMDKPEYITIHETDNEAAGATDEAHARLQLNGNSRQASWHVQVDDNSAIQSLPFNECAIAAGDGTNGPGNRKSIHIEICVNAGGDFKKAVANAADVARQLMKIFDIPISKVVQHNHWSGKNCPRHLRSGDKGVNWNDLLKMLQPTAVKNGWAQENGKWFFYKDGSAIKNNWAQDSKKLWYYLGETGEMSISKWVKWKEKWFYVNEKGVMLTGRKKIGTKEYLFQADGTLIITNEKGEIING